MGIVVGLAAQSGFSEAIQLGFIGSVVALLPDIDHPKSKIRQRIGRIGHLGLNWLPHRGLTHTLIFTVVIAFLALLLTTGLVVWVIPIAYFSHLMGDASTRRGIPLLWPFRKGSFHILPRRLLIRSGGRIDAVIAALNLVLIFSVIFIRYYV